MANKKHRKKSFPRKSSLRTGGTESQEDFDRKYSFFISMCVFHAGMLQGQKIWCVCGGGGGGGKLLHIT